VPFFYQFQIFSRGAVSTPKAAFGVIRRYRQAVHFGISAGNGVLAGANKII
jgi:hypothetical protein